MFDAIRQLGRAPRDLRHLIFTHGHPDHIGSAAAIVGETGATTYMHAVDAPLAGPLAENRIPLRIEQRKREGARAKPSEAYALVGMEFSTAEVGRDTAEFVAELQSIRMSEGATYSANPKSRPALEMNDVEKEESSQWAGHFLITRYRESFDRVIPGVGYLYVTSAPFQVPAGTPMVWKTEALSETGK